MTVVWIVFFSILLVSFITGICITVIEEKKTSSFVVLDKYVLPDRISLIQAMPTVVSEQESLELTMKMNKVTLEDDIDTEILEDYQEDIEVLSLEKTIIMKAIEVENLEKTMYFDTPILSPDCDEEII